MTEPVAEAARPPADLDARYQPFGPFAKWRQLPVDLHLVDEAAAELDRECRDTDPATVRAAVDFAVRAAAFDTGAIEGLYETDRGVTFAVAAQSAAWEAAVTEASGGHAVRHFQAQLEAFELVLDAVAGRTAISAAWLRALHEAICAGQSSYRALTPVGWRDLPLPSGQYKQMPNHVRQPDGSWHSYAPVDQVSPEMQRLVDEIGSAGFGAAHAVVRAAYVHYALVIQALRTARTEGALERLATLGDPDGVEPDEHQLRFAASRLYTVIQDELQDAASQLPGGVVTVQIDPTRSAAADRDLPPPVNVVASGAGRAGGAATTIAVSREPAGDWPVHVVAEDLQHRATVAPMRLRLDSLFPMLTTVARRRVREWARQVVNTLAAESLAGAPHV